MRGALVLGLSLSPDGNHLLSNSMDNSVRMWDVRPFANQNRLEKVFEGMKVPHYSYSGSDRLRSLSTYNTVEFCYIADSGVACLPFLYDIVGRN